LLVAQQHQLLVAKEEETKRLTALVGAQREAEVSKVNAEREAAVAIIAQQRETNVSIIRLQKEIKEKESEAQKLMIETNVQVERQKAQALAEANVALVRSDMQLKQKENEARMAAIDLQIYVDRQKAIADAAAYAIRTEGEALKTKLTPEFLRLALYQSLGNNTKIYFGSSIPNIFLNLPDSGFPSLNKP